jgi:hypothetical protein
MIIEDFWIFSDNWEPFVHFIKDPNNSNSFLFQQVDMNKIIRIQELILQDSTSKFTKPFDFQNDKYLLTFCFQKKIIILIRTDEFTKDKKILNLSKTLCDMVENLYKMIDFINWNMNISIFEILKKKLDLFMKMSNL